ncbi:MAG: hypothetical protein H6R12_1847 [Proteobacteria bacterium]|nr:hypothetical protein [Pseudomonadota bacterium]
MAMSAEDGISAEDTTPEAEYDAFISYSRRDMVFARALEKTLEAYRPPRDLPVPTMRTPSAAISPPRTS